MGIPTALGNLNEPSRQTFATKSATTGRKQVQQILEANSSNVMRNNRPVWLVDSSKTLYVAHRGKSL